MTFSLQIAPSFALNRIFFLANENDNGTRTKTKQPIRLQQYERMNSEFCNFCCQNLKNYQIIKKLSIKYRYRPTS